MERSPLLALHQSRRTRLAARPEAPEHAAPLLFGGVPEEYRAGREGCALFDASDRGRVTVGGPDATDFLHRLLSNHVKPLASGEGNANLLLSSKGKVLFAFDLLRHDEGFELSTPPGQAGALLAALAVYHFAESLTLEDTSAEHTPLELMGPQAAVVLAKLLGETHQPDAASRPSGSWRSCSWRERELRVQALESHALRIDGAGQDLPALWDALREAGATPTGLVARDCLRVEQGRALFGLDVDENVYPQEAGLESAFALDKGCYIGQEVVAKIDTYGGLNKRLLTLRVGHSDPVARGTRLYRQEKGERRDLGQVTSWAHSFALDTGMVLAFVKRKHQEPGTEFELGEDGARAVVVAPPG